MAARKILMGGIAVGVVLSFSGVALAQSNIYSFTGEVDLGVGYTFFESSGQHYIGARGDTVYVVTSNGWTWCAKSIDGGQTFDLPVLVNSTSTGVNPSMRVDTGGVVYVAYQDEYADIRFSKSTDGGVSFTPGVKVNDDTIPQTGQEKPAIAVNNKGQIFIAWRDQRYSAPQTHQTVFTAASYDGGQSFTPNIQGNDTSTDLGGTIDIAVDDVGRVYVVWMPNRRGIILSRSIDSGQTFPLQTEVADVPTDSTIAGSGIQSIAVGNELIGVVWQDRRFEQFTLRFSVSQDYGQTFSPSVRVDDDSDLSDTTAPQAPSLAWKNGIFYVAWHEYGAKQRISFSYSTNSGQSFVPSMTVDSFSSAHAFPSLEVNGSGKAFAAWLDSREDPFYVEDFRTLVAWGGPNSVKGDLNLDSLLTAVDVVLELNAVFLGQPYPASFETADVNCDGELTPADTVLELNAVFLENRFPCS